MDARQLRCFLGVVDHGGFGRAAEHLHLAQPSLSQTIAGLEREVGVPLFHRVGRRAVLSAAGEQLVEPARRVLRDLDAATDAARSTREARLGRLDLTAMPSVAVEPLTSLLTAYAAAHPGVTVRVDGAFTETDVVTRVRGGSAELGLMGHSPASSLEGLVGIPLPEQAFVLLSPPGSAFGSSARVESTELRDLRFVTTAPGSLMRRLLAELHGGEPVVAIEIDHRTSLLPLVLAGVGHAVVTDAWARMARLTGAEVRRLPTATRLGVRLVHRPRDLTPAAEAFVALATADIGLHDLH